MTVRSIASIPKKKGKTAIDMILWGLYGTRGSSRPWQAGRFRFCFLPKHGTGGIDKKWLLSLFVGLCRGIELGGDSTGLVLNALS